MSSQGNDRAMQSFGERDWRDLQLLSQLAWMDEEYLASDPVVSRLARKGVDYTEQDKQQLAEKQIELLGRVLPEYRKAAATGQIEISATPFYHPILPLLCDTDIARDIKSRHAAAGAGISPSGRRPGTTWCARAGIMNGCLGNCAGRAVALGGLGIRAGSRNRGGTRIQVVRHG